MLFSAKLGKFTWYMGETFEAELWLLNDAAAPVSGKVKAKLSVGGETYDLLEWNAETKANQNSQGPTLRFVLPSVKDDRMVLTLEGENGTSSTYTLQYVNKKEPRPAYKILNI